MRRLFLALIVALTLAFLATSASAESEMADWRLCAAHGDDYVVYYTINTNSLQVESFTTANNSDEWGYMRVAEDDGATIIFEMLVAPHTTGTQSISGFKFRRVPATDHDDPNSVRVPQGVQMGCRWPAF